MKITLETADSKTTIERDCITWPDVLEQIIFPLLLGAGYVIRKDDIAAVVDDLDFGGSCGQSDQYLVTQLLRYADGLEAASARDLATVIRGAARSIHESLQD